MRSITPAFGDQHVKAIPQRHRFRHSTLNSATLTHVDNMRRNIVADAVGRRLSPRLVAVADQDLRALLRQALGDGKADAVTGAGDHGTLAHKPHVSSPSDGKASCRKLPKTIISGLVTR